MNISQSEAKNIEHAWLSSCMDKRVKPFKASLNEICLQDQLQNASEPNLTLSRNVPVHFLTLFSFILRLTQTARNKNAELVLFDCQRNGNLWVGDLIAWHEGILFIVRWPTGSNGALMINFGYYKEYSICRNVICIIKNKSKMSFTWILMFRIFMIIVRLKKTRIEVTLCQHVNIMNLAAGFIYVT